MGNLGFTGCSSLSYSIRRPTRVLRTSLRRELEWERDADPTLRMHHFRSHRLAPAGSRAAWLIGAAKISQGSLIQPRLVGQATTSPARQRSPTDQAKSSP